MQRQLDIGIAQCILRACEAGVQLTHRAGLIAPIAQPLRVPQPAVRIEQRLLLQASLERARFCEVPRVLLGDLLLEAGGLCRATLLQLPELTAMSSFELRNVLVIPLT